MTRIDGHVSLQGRGFYSGATAVEILGRLDAAGQKAKYLALIFDVPYMIMQALVFEGLIAFGKRHHLKFIFTRSNVVKSVCGFSIHDLKRSW